MVDLNRDLLLNLVVVVVDDYFSTFYLDLTMDFRFPSMNDVSFDLVAVVVVEVIAT